MLKKINAFFGAQDMTEGKPMSVLLRFSILCYQQLCAANIHNTVDSIIVAVTSVTRLCQQSERLLHH